MHKFWYGYLKSKFGEKEKLFYMGTDSFIVYIETDDVYKDIPEDVKKKFHTSNYELERPLPKGRNKNVIDLTKDELEENIMKEFVGEEQ